ncbi:HAD family hydrolase [Brevibacterium spongiae]|uniref:HAD family phosphatase n=1 Tax=Brevibacterium spongiae TaxID=2909672 RepID=A0ABY5SSG0_9MICO|nr:HAD family phosphatase [Brevibacterium spongiae]UVI36046.1 HAD family phosphatase [Brevibacterium spongiae]
MTESDRPTPTTVVFDLGNVLIGWDQTGPLSDRMSAEEWHAFAEAADFPTLNTAADSGVPITELIARASESDPRHGEIIAGYYENFEKSLTGPIDGMAEVVNELRDSGVRLLGLSNWSAETIHHAPVVAPAINELEDIVVSGRVGMVKPDPAIFELLLTRFDLDPGRTVFVDDLPTNTEAAERLGILGHVFTDAASLRKDLSALGLLEAQEAPTPGSQETR